MNKDEEGEAFFITKIYSQENEYYYPLEWIIMTSQMKVKSKVEWRQFLNLGIICCDALHFLEWSLLTRFKDSSKVTNCMVASLC